MPLCGAWDDGVIWTTVPTVVTCPACARLAALRCWALAAVRSSAVIGRSVNAPTPSATREHPAVALALSDGGARPADACGSPSWRGR